jgi:hypothetical protein
VGVGVTHASFAGEVQCELPQAVRIIGLFRFTASAQAKDAQRQEARHLVEALGGAEAIVMRREACLIEILRCEHDDGTWQGFLDRAQALHEQRERA